eukprot:394426-Pyramimonas_sp.AAC.1
MLHLRGHPVKSVFAEWTPPCTRVHSCAPQSTHYGHPYMQTCCHLECTAHHIKRYNDSHALFTSSPAGSPAVTFWGRRPACRSH